MSDINIQCPLCHESFKLNETLAAPIIADTRRALERDFQEKEEALEKRREAFAEAQKAAENARKELAKERAVLAKQREAIEATIADPTLPVRVEGTITGVSQHVLDELVEQHKSKIERFVSEGVIRIRREQAQPGGSASDAKFSVRDPVKSDDENGA